MLLASRELGGAPQQSASCGGHRSEISLLSGDFRKANTLAKRFLLDQVTGAVHMRGPARLQSVRSRTHPLRSISATPSAISLSISAEEKPRSASTARVSMPNLRGLLRTAGGVRESLIG